MNMYEVRGIHSKILSLCEHDQADLLNKYFVDLRQCTPHPACFNYLWIDFMSVKGHNPLLTSIFNHSHKVTDFLIYQCWSVMHSGNKHRNGTTALHVAAYTHNMHALVQVVNASQSRQSLFILDEQDRWGRTALHHAYFHGFKEGVDFLLHSGAAVNVKDNWGNLAIDMPAQKKENQNQTKEVTEETGDPDCTSDGGGAADGDTNKDANATVDVESAPPATTS